MTELTIDLAFRELQHIFKPIVLLIVGTGAAMAMDKQFGMEALANELLAYDSLIHFNQWETVKCKLENGENLETNEQDCTYIENQCYPAPLAIKDSKLWEIQEFTREILGG